MKVLDIMKRDIQTVGPKTPARMAYEMMEQGGFRHLPVVDGEKLVGIVSDRDLRLIMEVSKEGLDDHSSDNVPEDVRVGDIMTEDPAIVMPDSEIRHVAVLMGKHKIGALPVLEHGRLVGMVTANDMINLLVSFLE